MTSPTRTILDLAATNHPRLERALTEAHVKGLIRGSAQTALLKRAQNRPGAAALKKLIESESHGFTRSEAERAMRKLLTQARLPQPMTNARVGGYEVDFFWPHHKLIVEVDGYGTHGHRSAFERDRRKDAALISAGYTVIRITWSELTGHPVAVAATVAGAVTAARGQH